MRGQHTQVDDQAWWWCVYCGAPATCRDHFVPRSYLTVAKRLRPGPRTDPNVLPACFECNTLAGAQVFPDVAAKRSYLRERLAQRYRRVLRMPYWSQAEIDDLGFELQTQIATAVATRRQVRQRLAFMDFMNRGVVERDA